MMQIDTINWMGGWMDEAFEAELDAEMFKDADEEQGGKTIQCFDHYGVLEWLEPEDFYAEGWSIFGAATGEDGTEYDVVLSADHTDLRFTVV